MAKNKLTKQMVIADVMAIIRPSAPAGKTVAGDNRGAALIQAMLQKAKQSGTQPRVPPVSQPTVTRTQVERGR